MNRQFLIVSDLNRIDTVKHLKHMVMTVPVPYVPMLSMCQFGLKIFVSVYIRVAVVGINYFSKVLTT